MDLINNVTFSRITNNFRKWIIFMQLIATLTTLWQTENVTERQKQFCIDGDFYYQYLILENIIWYTDPHVACYNYTVNLNFDS